MPMHSKLGFITITTLFLTSCFNLTTEEKKSTKKVAAQQQEDTQAANPTHVACAQESCGPATSLPYLSEQPKTQDRDLYKQHVEPLLNQYADASVRYVNLKNKVVSEFSDMQVDHISDSYLALVNFMYFSKYSEPVSKSLTNTQSGIKVSVGTLRRELTKVGLVDQQLANWVIVIATTVYESDIFYINYYLSRFPLEIFVQKKYPNTDALTAIALEAEKLLKVQEQIYTAYPIFKAQSADTIAMLKKAIRKEPLDPDEKEDFIDSRMSLLTLQEVLPGGRWRGRMLQKPNNIKSLVAEMLKKAKSSGLGKSNSESLQKEKQNYLFQCTYHLLKAVASSPTPEQNLQFSNMVQSLKSEARNVLAGHHYSTPAVLRALDKVDIVLPATKQQTATALFRALQSEISVIKSSVELFSNLDSRNQEDKELVVLLLATQYTDDDKEDTALSSVKEFCEENMAAQISDASYTAYQLINVGWRSVLYPNFGYGIASHELGHVISTADETSLNPAFSRIKTCLKTNQNGSEDFIEEDFADTFAIQMINQKAQNQKSQKNGNYSCLLLSQDGTDYTDLQIGAEKGSVHSSSFYRLLVVGSEIGELAPSCQKAKGSSPLAQRTRNCWGL